MKNHFFSHFPIVKSFLIFEEEEDDDDDDELLLVL